MHTICITGGHHNSALVVAQELIKRGHQVVWIGHRYAARGDQHDSAEYIEVKSAGIPFYDLTASRLLADPRELIRFPLGLFAAFQLLRHLRPTAILSFGGYLGGSVALTAKLLRIPIYLHEQTVTAGKANKLIGILASKIYLTWSESAQYFDSGKIMLVGLPLRYGVLTAKPKHLFARAKPTLLVMGGKQGAHAINQFVFTHLSDLLQDFNLVHQTGTSSLTGDYDHAVALDNTLSSLADCYLPVGYISETDIGTYLASADVYLGRSGAHICYELGVIGLPGVLVPLSSTHDHEQHKNASILVASKRGVILAQNELSLRNLHRSLKALKSLSPQKLPLPVNATSVLVNDLLTELK